MFMFMLLTCREVLRDGVYTPAPTEEEEREKEEGRRVQMHEL